MKTEYEELRRRLSRHLGVFPSTQDGLVELVRNAASLSADEYRVFTGAALALMAQHIEDGQAGNCDGVEYHHVERPISVRTIRAKTKDLAISGVHSYIDAPFRLLVSRAEFAAMKSTMGHTGLVTREHYGAMAQVVAKPKEVARFEQWAIDLAD